MQFRFGQLCLAAATCSTVLTGSAYAQAALDDSSAAAPAAATPDPAAVTAPKDEVEYGVGLRLRNVRIPKAELELFMERAPGGTSNFGVGVDLTRRRGNVELQLGFEFEHVQPPEGVYIEGGKNVVKDEADYILGSDRADSNLGWFTVEFTFLNHSEIAKNFFLRYGGGAGLGIITGSLKRIDVACAPGSSNSNVDPGCVPPGIDGGTATPTQGNVPVKYDLPPVFPVVNAIIGAQYRPTPKSTINFEMGIRTVLFLGFSGSYFF